MAAEKGRYAVILKKSGEVSDIKLMEGGPPEINNEDEYTVTEVPGDVQIGMVKKGSGFEWPDKEAPADRYGTGAVRTDDTPPKKVAEK